MAEQKWHLGIDYDDDSGTPFAYAFSADSESLAETEIEDMINGQWQEAIDLKAENEHLRRNLLETAAMLDFYLGIDQQADDYELAWGQLTKARRDEHRDQVDVDAVTSGMGMWQEDDALEDQEQEETANNAGDKEQK